MHAWRESMVHFVIFISVWDSNTVHLNTGHKAEPWRRRLARVFHQSHIINEPLYINCTTLPMFWDVRQARRNLFRHVLWLLPQSLRMLPYTSVVCHPNSQNERVSWMTPDWTYDCDQRQTMHSSCRELNIPRPQTDPSERPRCAGKIRQEQRSMGRHPPYL